MRTTEGTPRMEIDVFGKQGCPRCESTKRKLDHFLQKWNLAQTVPMKWFDMDTVDGRAEGAFQDVFSVPTVILLRDGQEVKRWAGELPDSNEVRSHLGA
jgi:thiol-disulfide isomerase/thioredoxin